jgi:hypothetical protein
VLGLGGGLLLGVFGFLLDDCYDLGKTGRYRLIANYQDGNPDAPQAPVNTTRLVKPLQSKPIVIKIGE